MGADHTEPSLYCVQNGETYCLPTRFERVSAAEAGQVMYGMPLFSDEVILPPLNPETKKYYEKSYDNLVFESADPDCIPEVRGIRLGDSLSSVIGRFLFESNLSGGGLEIVEDDDSINDTDEQILYGNLAVQPGGRIVFEGERPIMAYYDSGMWASFSLDENLCVCKIAAGEGF